MKPLKAIIKYLEIPTRDQWRRARQYQRERDARFHGLDPYRDLSPPWRYLPRYQKLILILGWAAIIALASIGFI